MSDITRKGIWVCTACNAPQPLARRKPNKDGTADTWDTSCIECKEEDCRYIKPPQGCLYVWDDELLERTK